jgi:hypothetical protein
MPTLNDLGSMESVVQFVAWCFVVWAIANAVFRSFPAAELWNRAVMKPGRNREMQKLLWELRNAAEWHPRAATGDKLVEPRRLTGPELSERETRLAKLKRRTLPARLAAYLLNCVFCQNVWVSLLLALCLSSWSSFWSEAVPTALAYSGLTTIGLGMFTATVTRAASHTTRSACPGGNCGGARNAS